MIAAALSVMMASIGIETTAMGEGGFDAKNSQYGTQRKPHGYSAI
jgi:hypothetical protein